MTSTHDTLLLSNHGIINWTEGRVDRTQMLIVDEIFLSGNHKIDSTEFSNGPSGIFSGHDI